MILVDKIITIVVLVIVIAVILLPVTNDLRSDEENTIDILLIDGQSNGAYYTNNTALCDPSIVNQELGAPEHKAYYYGTSEGSSNTVTSNTTIREMYRNGSWKIGGNQAGLAYYLMEKNHRDVLVINIASGGMGIKELATGETWTKGKAVVDDALAKISTLYESKNFIGWILIHGESDKYQTVSFYEQYFNVLNNNLNNLGFSKCYIALPRQSQSLNSYDAMLDLAANNPNIVIATSITKTFTTSNGLLNEDDVHYTQKGRLVLSKAIIEAIPATPNYDPSIAGLFQAIPIILLVGVVLMAVRLLYLRTR